MHNPILLGAAALLAASTVVAQDSAEIPRNRFDTDILAETFGYDTATPASVEIESLYQGCPTRDCIPSIDDPSYESVQRADEWLADGALVMAVEIDGQARAFHVRILDRHEIVNDTIAGRAVAITWCPLCGSGVAFDRNVGGDVLEFGVSGLLHGSDLVMYDRTSESLWQQITGEAIVGPRLGVELDRLPLAFSEWHEWRSRNPDGKVLARPSRWGIDYGRRPYGDYDESARLMFPAENRDFSVHPKTVVYGFDIDGDKLAVLEESLPDDAPVETRLGDRSLTIERRDDGTVVATGNGGGEAWTATRLFWFAWYNFNPDTARL